jgi:hypothetical protein
MLPPEKMKPGRPIPVCSGVVWMLTLLVCWDVTFTRAMCPRECDCSGRTVDCSYKGLSHLPKGISRETERL